MRIETRRSADAWKKLRRLRPPSHRPLSTGRGRQLRSRDCRLETRTIYSFAPLRRSLNPWKHLTLFIQVNTEILFWRLRMGARGTEARASVVLNRTPAKTNFSLGVIISWKYLFRICPPPPSPLSLRSNMHIVRLSFWSGCTRLVRWCGKKDFPWMFCGSYIEIVLYSRRVQ